MSKNWKDHLLSSGLPLEQSVIGVLQTLGIDRPREFRYERVNEQGVLTGFSIDVFASQMYDHCLVLELLIECKHRHDGVRWVFIPDDFAEYWGPSFEDAFVILDNLCGPTVDRDALNRHEGIYQLCYKGTEILEKDANPKSIEQCIQQLRYAVLENSIDTLRTQVDEDYPLDHAFVQVPIIVTTAELWRLRPDVTLDKIRAADDLPNVADQMDVIILHDPPDKTFQTFARRRFNERISDSERDAIETDLKGKTRHNFYSWVNTFSTSSPSMFVVIHYSRFESAMKNVFGFFRNASVMVRKKKPEK